MISIVIPVYNVDKYLSQCLESIINQTYQDLEIIIIDDGSSDNSPQICDEFAKKDKRITVIHKENGGAASARNEGLRKATGDFLAFVDSDDYIEKNAYSTMMEVMSREGADIVECAFSFKFRDKETEEYVFQEEKQFDQIKYLSLFTTQWTCGLIWNKLFRREVLHNVFFEEGHQIDDEFFTYQGVMTARKIVFAPSILYHYRMRASGLMKNPEAYERILFDRLDYSTKRRRKVVEQYPELKQVFDHSYLESLVFWSRDDRVTARVIHEIQILLADYFKTNKPCKMKPGFRLQLLKLQHANPEKLLAKRPPQAPKKDENQYYE